MLSTGPRNGSGSFLFKLILAIGLCTCLELLGSSTLEVYQGSGPKSRDAELFLLTQPTLTLLSTPRRKCSILRILG